MVATAGKSTPIDVDLVTVAGKLEKIPSIRCWVRNLRDH
jgi:hypothetical protein